MAETKNPTEHDADTRMRVLASAAEVFAEKGYRDATIAEICQRAEANIAAVNYYFRSKENLYAEAWQRAFRRSLAAHPPGGGVPDDAPPAERLVGLVGSIVARIVDPNSHEFEIVQKEHANPTGLLAEVMRESIGPLRRRMRQIVRDLLGPGAPEPQIALCQASLMGQCLHLLLKKRHGRRIFGNDATMEMAPEVLAGHIVRFSLAGIAEVRRCIEAERQAGEGN